jgi:hypothetical protein
MTIRTTYKHRCTECGFTVPTRYIQRVKRVVTKQHYRIIDGRQLVCAGSGKVPKREVSS